VRQAAGRRGGVRVRGAQVGQALLRDVDLDVHAGEVVAVAGVSGNGQATLADVLCGEHALDAGTLQVAGRTLPAQPRAFVDAGVARMPEDRHAVGVVGDLPLWENAVLERYHQPAFSRHGHRRRAAVAHAADLVARFDVRGTEEAAGPHRDAPPVGRQHAEAHPRPRAGRRPARVRKPALIVANQPTWGLDIGAVAYVHQQLLDAGAAGSAVLLISEDLDEIFALADRIAVMHHGRLTGAAPRPTGRWRAIGLAMAGALGRRARGRMLRLEARAADLARAAAGRAVAGHRSSRWLSVRCWWPGPARRWARPTRCCWKAASARALR
jgi:ABC-type uncharacterized transport system ATPase subunit